PDSRGKDLLGAPKQSVDQLKLDFARRRRERAASRQRRAFHPLPARKKSSHGLPTSRTRPKKSKQPHPRCSRLLVALPAILSPYLQPCWRTPSASAMPSMETSIAGTASFCTSLPHTTRHRLSPDFADVQRFDRRSSVAWWR